MLTNDLVVVDDGSAIIFLFIVKFRDFVRVGRLLVLENVEVSTRLRCFLALRIVEEEILERSFGVGCGSGVLCPGLGRGEPDVTDLILRIHCQRFIGELVHHRLVRLQGRIVRALFLTRKTNIELRPGCVSSIRRGANNVGENSHRAI